MKATKFFINSCMLRKREWKIIYYHEFGNTDSSYMLFNLKHYPEEKNDLSKDPQYKPLALDMLQDIKKRWSAEKILQKLEKKQNREQITVYGPEKYPHPLPEYTVPGDVNQFDTRQII
ncbi:MAG TPA: hypothetical protein DC049_13205 [Spirochaetia bacterium]|nr:hypothetical protein [Spirochaetia bacterium]